MSTTLHAILADITTLHVDAIVNAAHASLLPSGGVCGAIHRVAGPELAQTCQVIGSCPAGDARLTKGYGLPARYVIHAVGPLWDGGDSGEPDLLASCYRRCLELAAETGIQSIAFPSISTGIHGYPIDLAAGVAVSTLRASLTGFPMIRKVIFCCHSPQNLALYQELLAQTR